MRALADRARIERVIEALGRAADHDTRIYLVGGTTAVLLGWRSTTVDIDLVVRPEDDALLRGLAAIKERFDVNVETASPLDFIPVPPGWEERSVFIRRVDHARFYHFDLYAQALAKVERGHAQDLADVQEMIRRGLVEPRRAREYFDEIAPQLYRFPATDAPTFRRAVEAAFLP